MAMASTYEPVVFTVRNKRTQDAPKVRPFAETKQDAVFRVDRADTWRHIEPCPCFKEARALARSAPCMQHLTKRRAGILLPPVGGACVCVWNCGMAHLPHVAAGSVRVSEP